METKRILALGLLALLAIRMGVAHAWDEYPGFLKPGYQGIVIGDFDGDGSREAAVSGMSEQDPHGSRLIAVLSGDAAGQIGVRAMSMLMTPLTGRMILAPREGAADRIAVLAEGEYPNRILVLGGVPLRIVRSIPAPTVERLVAIADVDADGHLDIVVLLSYYAGTPKYPAVLDYETGAIKWISPNPGDGVGVAQLDDDAALEIILSGVPGRVIDGASHDVEWTYANGFTNEIIVGRFGSDSRVGFASMLRFTNTLQIFRSGPYSQVSQIETGPFADSSVVQLGERDADYIVIGSPHDGVLIYDPRTGECVVSIPNFAQGVSALAIGDIDGDGDAEVVFGGGGNGTGTTALHVVDLDTLHVVYLRHDEVGPHSGIARGDLQGNGADQVVYVTAGSNNDYNQQNLHVLDAKSGVRLRSRSIALPAEAPVPQHVALAQLDNDPQQEIIIAGGFDRGTVAVYDGVSLEEQWRVSGSAEQYVAGGITALAVIDMNGDGTPDVVVATLESRLVLLDGRNGALRWPSARLSGSTLPSLAAFRSPTGDPRVAMGSGEALYVFDLWNPQVIASAKTAAGVIGVTQWGEGDACRIGALDEAAMVTIHRCDTLALEGQRQLPAGSVFFRPLDEHGDRFIAASGAYLHEVAPDGTSIPMAGPLGNELGAGNLGIVSQPDPQHVEVLIGSDYLVTRRLLGFDAMFANSFD